MLPTFIAVLLAATPLVALLVLYADRLFPFSDHHMLAPAPARRRYRAWAIVLAALLFAVVVTAQWHRVLG